MNTQQTKRKRGRPRNAPLLKIFVVLQDGKLSFNAMRSAEEACAIYPRGRLVAELPVSEYLSREKEYQYFLKSKYEEGTGK